MSQPTIPVMRYDFSSSLGTEEGLQLDDNFQTLVASTTEIIRNIALLQRDDGAVLNQIIHSNSFTSDALALMAGSSVASATVDWLPRGTWVTATLYNVGNIIETGAPATAYVCSVQHISGVFATDYAAHKWVVLSTPRTLISADVTGALGYTPVNKAGDTMLGALTLTTGSILGGASGATISDTYVAQDLLKINKGLYSNYETSVNDLAYGFAANVVRAAGDYITVGAQCSALGAFAMTQGLFGSNFNSVGLNGFNGYQWGQEIDVGSFTPNNTKFKYGLNVIFFDRQNGATNPGEYTYTFPGVGTYANAGAGLGSNFYNKLAKAIVLESQARSATGEYCGWTRGLHFGEFALDSETNAAYAGSRAYPIGIDFSELHYYGGTDPVTSFNLEAAIAMRDFQSIWWNRDPATAAAAVDKVRTYFNPAVSRWVLTNGGAEVIGFDVTTGDIYQNGVLGAFPGLASNNVWTGTNEFDNDVTLNADFGFIGSSQRITGDFTSAAIGTRVLVQTSTLNGSTEFGIIPNGAGGESAFYICDDSAVTNGQVARISISNVEMQINSGKIGGGAYVPMTFATNGLEMMRIIGAPRQLLINATTSTNAAATLRVNGIIQCDNPVAFSVNRNGVNTAAVANNILTQIDWTTEIFDTNLCFDLGTDRFTPPAGKYVLIGSVGYGGAVTDQDALVVSVTKNGVAHMSGNVTTASGAAAVSSQIHCIVEANGTDYFELCVTQVNAATTTRVMTGLITDTYFQGYRIA